MWHHPNSARQAKTDISIAGAGRLHLAAFLLLTIGACFCIVLYAKAVVPAQRLRRPTASTGFLNGAISDAVPVTSDKVGPAPSSPILKGRVSLEGSLYNYFVSSRGLYLDHSFPTVLLSSVRLCVPQDGERTAPPLETVLRRAAMADKTVILTTLNAAWSSPDSILDVFLESFRIGEGTGGLVDHLVVVAVDGGAYARCRAAHPHCYALATDGVDFSGEKVFMSDGYLKMMWRRIEFLRTVLELGYHFIFTDLDIMWFRDPLPHLRADADFQIACDRFNGNSSDPANAPNGGFNHVRSNSRTVAFYKFWYSSREKHPGFHDQDVLNFIKHDPFIRRIGLRMRFLDTAVFGGFCQPGGDLDTVCTMHANCCIGLRRKLLDLRLMLDDWRAYRALRPAAGGPRPSWSGPRNCWSTTPPSDANQSG